MLRAVLLTFAAADATAREAGILLQKHIRIAVIREADLPYAAIGLARGYPVLDPVRLQARSAFS